MNVIKFSQIADERKAYERRLVVSKQIMEKVEASSAFRENRTLLLEGLDDAIETALHRIERDTPFDVMTKFIPYRLEGCRANEGYCNVYSECSMSGKCMFGDEYPAHLEVSIP